MTVAERTVRWSFIRRLAQGLSWAIAILLIAAIVNAIGISLMGNVDGWADWLKHHSLYFLGWRLCLYSATGYGWRWMRHRVLLREQAAETRTRLRRVEIGAVLAILTLEGTMLVGWL